MIHSPTVRITRKHDLFVAVFALAALSPLVWVTSAQAEAPPAPPKVRLVAEMGYLAVLSHKIQFGNNGTYVDYVEDGGQDVLFPVSRLSAELAPSAHHRLVFLYQPLALESRVLAAKDLVVDDQTFPQGSGVILRYGFPFWRASYLYDFEPDPLDELAIGISLQIRDATIEFESTDGTRFRSNRDVGPVPILKARWRTTLAGGWWLGAEVDGFYAPISYINGSDNEVVGAIADASLRAGLRLKGGVEWFLNVRYLGGGATGTSDRAPTEPGDGYVRNWLHFLTVSLGATFDGFAALAGEAR